MKMQVKMQVLGVKFPPNLHDETKAAAESEGVSVSEFIRQTVVQRLRNGSATNDDNTTDIVPGLFAQLAAKDKQISQLHQLAAMAQTNLGEVTKQLEDKRRSWWQRLTRRTQYF